MPSTMEEMIQWTKEMEVAVPLPQWYFDFLEMIKNEAEEFIPYEKVRVRKLPLVVVSLDLTCLLYPAPSSCVQYHKAVNLPSNFIAFGDSVTRVNPFGGYV